MSTPTHMDAAARSRARRAVVAASLGNALEWFDIIVYAFFAVVISKLFFPSKDGVVGLLLTFSTFALAYFVRPIGAIIISHFADKHGRKGALTLTIALMTLGVAIMGLAPPYTMVGWLAPALVVLARLLQGFSAGGEFGSATAFMTENAEERKAFYASWQVATQGISMFLAGGFGWLLNTQISQSALYAWGWRVPYLVGLVIGPVGWWIRTHMDDTPEFQHTETVDVPIATLLRHHVGRVLTAAGCVGVATLSVYLITYMPTFAQRNLHLPPFSGYVGATVAGLVTLVIAPLIGKLADRVGAVTVMLPSALLGLVLAWPMFKILVANPSLLSLTLVEVILGLLMAFYFAPLPALMSAMYPTNIRTTGMSLSYNIGVTLLGGITPVVLTWLIAKYSLLAPSFYYIAVAVVSLISLVFARMVFRQR